MIRKPTWRLLFSEDNHPTLCQAVHNEFFAALEADVHPRNLRKHVTVETSRSRLERREYFAMPAPETLPGLADWANLATIVIVIRITTINGKETGETS